MIKRDDACKAVVKFTTPIITNGKIYYSIGTGFFMNTDQSHLYIITANHVAKDFNDNTQIQMSGQAGVTTVLLKNMRTPSPIIDHPTADLSAIEIDVPTYNGLNSKVIIFHKSIIDTNKIMNISRDEELTSIGFPNGLGVSTTTFSPLTFRSYPASNIIKNMSGLSGGYVSDTFVMENASCGGYSGCPVLDLGYKVTGMMTQTSNTYIYGVMHGTISDNTGGKMAVVTPANYILDII